MLERLLISKVRIKILKLFLENPQKEFHVRGIMREIDEEINSVRRELKNLSQIGLLTSIAKGNKLFYSCNCSHIFVNELRYLLDKNKEEVQTIWRQLQRVKNIDLAILTENFLKNEYHSNLDIDLLIIGDIKIDKLQKKINLTEKKLKRELRVTILTPTDFNFHLQKQSNFLIKILKKYKIFLIGSEEKIFNIKTPHEKV